MAICRKCKGKFRTGADMCPFCGAAAGGGGGFRLLVIAVAVIAVVGGAGWFFLTQPQGKRMLKKPVAPAAPAIAREPAAEKPGDQSAKPEGDQKPGAGEGAEKVSSVSDDARLAALTAEYAGKFKKPSNGTDITVMFKSGTTMKGVIWTLTDTGITIATDTGAQVTLGREALHMKTRAMLFKDDFARANAESALAREKRAAAH